MPANTFRFNSPLIYNPALLSRVARNRGTTPSLRPAVAVLAMQPLETMVRGAVKTRKVATPVEILAIAQPFVPGLVPLRPVFSPLFVNIPIEKDKLTVPISQNDQVTDTQVYSDANNASKKYYIPRYRLSEKNVAGKQQLSIKLQQVETGGGKLSIDLVPYPAETIKRSVSGAEYIKSGIEIVLKYTVDGMIKEMSFDQIEESDTELTAIMTAGELSQLFQSMTDSHYESKLVIKQTVTVAVPYMVKNGDTGKMIHKRSISNQPLYVNKTNVIECRVKPGYFVFSKELYGYIYEDIINVSSVKKGFIRRQVQYNGEWYSYYQDEAELDTFYYLPDAFKLGRSPIAPYYPLMSIFFESEDSTIENTRVNIQYVALPHIEFSRFKKAGKQLEQFIPDTMPEDKKRVIFAPVLSENVDYKLLLPRDSDGNNALESRTEALIDLRTGIKDHITLSYQQFQTVYDSLFGGVSVLLNGDLTINLGVGDKMMIDKVPLKISMNDLEGELFEYHEVRNPDTNGIKAVFQNAIESSVHIDKLPVEIYIDGIVGQASYSTISLQKVSGDEQLVEFPIDMDPGDKLVIEIVTDTPIEDDTVLDVVFNLDYVVTKPIPEAVWSVILDPSVPAEYKRQIRVSGLIEWFNTLDNPIRVILVEFEKGETVQLDPSNLTVETEIRLPIRDMILKSIDEGEFRYKVTLILQDGGKKKHQKWITDTIEILYPELPKE